MSTLREYSLVSVLVSVATIVSGCGQDADDKDIEFPDASLVQTTSESGNLLLDLRSSPQPPEQGTNHFQAFIVHAQGYRPATGLDLEVEAWMPAHDHGSPSEPVVEELGQGRYLIRDVAFHMAGEWELVIRILGPEEDRFVVTLQVE